MELEPVPAVVETQDGRVSLMQIDTGQRGLHDAHAPIVAQSTTMWTGTGPFAVRIHIVPIEERTGTTMGRAQHWASLSDGVGQHDFTAIATAASFIYTSSFSRVVIDLTREED